jgi:RNA polymerase sigma factor (sigma-70 family)
VTFPAHVPDAETLALARHETQRIATAIDRLPSRMRQVIELSIDEDRKLREVAITLGVSQTRVHQLRQEAISQVQKSYQAFSLFPQGVTSTPNATSTAHVLTASLVA